MIISCIQVLIYAKQKAKQIIEQMIKKSCTEAKSKNRKSRHGKLAIARVNYYKSLLNHENIFSNTGLEHSFLDKATNKLIQSK
jgi:hypothetical protein